MHVTLDSMHTLQLLIAMLVLKDHSALQDQLQIVLQGNILIQTLAQTAQPDHFAHLQTIRKLHVQKDFISLVKSNKLA